MKSKPEKKYTLKDIDKAIERTADAVWKRFKEELYQPILDENKRLKYALAILQNKRPRGRPKVIKSTLATAFGLGGPKEKNKGGRPKQHTKKNMTDLLELFEKERTRLAKIKGVSPKSLIDLRVIEHIVDMGDGETILSATQKREEIRKLRSLIKYFRDQTKIRTRKRKTLSKKI